MNNIFKKISYSIIIAIIICSLSVTNLATSKQDLQNQESDLKKKIDETNSEIEGVQNEKSDALKDVNTITTKISDSERKISELGSNITLLSDQIESKEKSILEQETKYQEQKKLLDKRLIAVYQSGSTTFLDVLLSSSSITDFISKYYLVEKIAESDKELLNQIQDLKTQIESEKTTLEKDKVSVENTKKEEENEQEALQKLKGEKEVLVANLSEEEKGLQKQLEEYEEDKRMVDEEIAKILAQEESAKKEKEKAKKETKKKTNQNTQNSSNQTNNNSENNSETNDVDNTEDNSSKKDETKSEDEKQANEEVEENETEEEEDTEEDEEESEVSSEGFICPIAGRSKSDITTGYYAYSGHTGVDFARNSKGSVEGLPVLAAKSGTVITSKALKNSNGNYRSYGEYIVINHGDGTLSLYAHMQPGSRTVSVGDKVSQGEQIGNVGTTGNSTGYHLHFEIKIVSGASIKNVNPANYLP